MVSFFFSFFIKFIEKKMIQKKKRLGVDCKKLNDF